MNQNNPQNRRYDSMAAGADAVKQVQVWPSITNPVYTIHTGTVACACLLQQSPKVPSDGKGEPLSISVTITKKRLGTGSYGAILLAVDNTSGEQLAVKKVASGISVSATAEWEGQAPGGGAAHARRSHLSTAGASVAADPKQVC